MMAQMNATARPRDSIIKVIARGRGAMLAKTPKVTEADNT
jgi:hypothetical protein